MNEKMKELLRVFYGTMHFDHSSAWIFQISKGLYIINISF